MQLTVIVFNIMGVINCNCFLIQWMTLTVIVFNIMVINCYNIMDGIVFNIMDITNCNCF